jgi:hypothetical protein
MRFRVRSDPNEAGLVLRRLPRVNRLASGVLGRTNLVCRRMIAYFESER